MIKLTCSGWDRMNHSQAMMRTNFEGNCLNGQISMAYENLSTAAGMFPDFAGFDNLEQNQLDIALFLANVSKETTGAAIGSPQYYGFAFCWTKEMGSPTDTYGNQDNPVYDI